MTADIPRTHGELMKAIKVHERTLKTVSDQQAALIVEVKRGLPQPVMIALVRQNTGGRVYCRWRWRFGSRSFFDLLTHLYRFEPVHQGILIRFETRRVELNFEYSITYHSYRRLLELKDRRAQLRQWAAATVA